MYRITSPHTSFPDTGRANGHMYKNVLYSVAEHYMDSSVVIVAPKNLQAGKTVDIIFWFHGWGANIDTVIAKHQIVKQFLDANVNAVIVFAETAKNSPDSYGGKLENNGVFKDLASDVMTKLRSEKIINKKCNPGKIVLAGHSGAYRVMAYILQNGGLPVKEVILFDALYSETNKYISWLQSDNDNRFIDIYTNEGGTDAESKEMVKQLNALHITPATVEEKEVTPGLLQKEKIVFIHSLNTHSGILKNPDNVRLFIENSDLKKVK